MNGEHRAMVWLPATRYGLLALSFVSIALSSGNAQQIVAKPPVKTPAAGGNSFAGPADIRYEMSAEGGDQLIDRFIGHWQDSAPRYEHGSLVLRDILTKGNNLVPPQPGAVLQAANFLAYGRIQRHDSTTPETLDGQQEVYYIQGGEGEITAGGITSALHKDIAVFVPEGLEFTMKNTGDEDLTMYVINEPTPKGFVPRKDMMVKDETKVPPRVPMEASPYTLPGASGHWAHVVYDLFSRTDGLATIGDVITVDINPMTMGEPHPHRIGQEEIWCAIDGTSLAFLGTQLRVDPAGMAYMIRPDETMTHSNINVGDTPVKFLWFSGSSIPK
jgi:mannose-6-phosphate isomerase-like protein (cupin superfamily)